MGSWEARRPEPQAGGGAETGPLLTKKTREWSLLVLPSQAGTGSTSQTVKLDKFTDMVLRG